MRISDWRDVCSSDLHHGVTIEKMLVTHGHLDHASAVAELAEQLGVPIEGPHEDDLFWIEGLPEAAARYGFPPARSFTPDRWLTHGDMVELGSLRFDVLHCPGHTDRKSTRLNSSP